MTVSIQTSAVTHLGNGSVTVWGFAFPVPNLAWLQVKTKDPTGALSTVPSTDYTVLMNPDGIGGSLTYPLSGEPLQVGWRIRIRRVVPLVQEVSIVDQGSYYPELLEGSADYSVFIDQQLDQRIVDLTGNDLWD